MYYLVRRSSAITTAMNLKNVYVTVPGFDKGSATADVVNNLSAVTMEAIIRVNTFDEGTEISSIMGIEMTRPAIPPNAFPAIYRPMIFPLLRDDTSSAM